MRPGENGPAETLWNSLRAGLGEHTGVEDEPRLLAGPSDTQLNQCLTVGHGGMRYFIKVNDAHRLAMFEAEMDGLNALASAGGLVVPHPVCCALAGAQAFLVMQHLDLHSRGNVTALGEGLASIHHCTGGRFGWKRDNSIGLTPQVNEPMDDWVSFWSQHRLGFQLRLALENGHTGFVQTGGERLLEQLDMFFRPYRPRPALLHGDLWAGNHAYLQSGEPVIFDPAVYFGDHEADLAMTELFGGYDQEFHAAYRSCHPLDPGYGVRKVLYNLYHILNHLNLFGGGYRAQAESMIARLLAELG